MTEHANIKLTSLRAYARHRKCQLKAVQDAIASSRLEASVTQDSKGVNKILDVALADQEWAANTQTSKTPQARRERDAAMGLGRAAAPSTVRRPTASANLATGNTRAARSSDPDEDEDEDEGEDGGGGETVTTTQARAAAEERAWKAKTAEMNYRKRSGELIEASEVAAAWAGIVTNTKTRLLAVPSKARQKLSKLDRADVVVLEDLIREALEELAGPAEGEGAAP